jgi:hypothetical protein
MSHKLGIPIRNDTPWQAVKFDDFFEKQVRNMSCVIGFLAWYEMCHLGKSIYYHKD